MKYERVFTENPINSLWNRLEILTTQRGVENVLKAKASENQQNIDDEILIKKSKGIAFCIRSAKELFLIGNTTQLTPSLLNLYYGTYNLLSAILLSDLSNDNTLEDIEKYSQNGGHGIKSIATSLSNNSTEIDINKFSLSEFIYTQYNGFFRYVLGYWNISYKDVGYDRKISKESINDASKNQKLISFKDLLSRIPELRNIFIEIFKEQPNYIHYLTRKDYSPKNPKPFYLSVTIPKSYNTEFLTQEKIVELLDFEKNYTFTFSSSQDQFLCENQILLEELDENPKYKTTLNYDVQIKPLLSEIDDPLLLHFLLLYQISIWTRYRPNLWRELCEGNKDQLKSLFVNYCDVAQRIIPNLFLNKFYGKDILFAGGSYL